MQEKEIWKDVGGYEGLYMVSNLGRVKSFHRKEEHILSPGFDRYGYRQVGLSKDGKNKRSRIHRLVALAFIENPLNKSDVNHKDSDRSNNTLANLEWNTSSENSRHSHRTGSAIPDYAHRYVFVYDKDDNFVKGFSSVKSACRWLGVSLMSLNGCCNGLVKELKGYRTMYIGVSKQWKNN